MMMDFPILQIAAVLISGFGGLFYVGLEAEFEEKSLTQVQWKDGDSGTLGYIEFRLANVDAPELTAKTKTGGARCTAERHYGFRAKKIMTELTKGKDVDIINSYGQDKYGRYVVELSINGQNISQYGINKNILKPWPFENGRALTAKPDWCNGFN